jgi:formylglycine-generating enzyme required for sulfatase activity
MNLLPNRLFSEFVESANQECQLDLSPIELAEILWLAIQQGETIIPEVDIELVVSEPLPTTVVEPQEEADTSIATSPVKIQPPEVVADVVLNEPMIESEEQKSAGSLPMKVPEVAALRNRRQISRALRPLLCKVPSKSRQVIDEEATALRAAEEKIWLPVVRPEPERWLELAIVIEATNLLDVWQETIDDFRHLLERHGAFRDVRTWRLQAVANEKPTLFLQTANGLNKRPRSPKELLDVGGRRLVLFVSDCTSDGWRSGKILTLLKEWSQESPVTICQLLPYHYWERSALGAGYPVRIGSRSPGALSRDWLLTGLSLRQQQRLQKGQKFPVVTIQSQFLQEWAQALVATGEQQTTGIVLMPEAFATYQGIKEVSLTPQELVKNFRMTASPQAQELADVMSVLPVNWSVLRLIQKSLEQHSSIVTKAFAPESGALYLAEIFLSGLLYQVSPEETGQKKTAKKYDFVLGKLLPEGQRELGVRDILRRSIPISIAQAAGEEIAKEVFAGLPENIRTQVSADIRQRFGEAWSYFDAFLIPNLPWGNAEIDVQSFAQVREETLNLWGGQYAEWAQELKNSRVPVATEIDVVGFDREYVNLPPLQEVEFDVVTVRGALEAHNFEVATLVQKKTSLLQRKTTWVVETRPGQAWQFTESLGNGVELVMVNISAGEFLMGAPIGELESHDDERPQHFVKVPEFYFGKYPVTQAQWKSIANLPSINQELDPDISRFKGDNLPVEDVYWNDASEFCQRLSKLTGQSYRLPSEAEWEYACRAGTITPFHFGETISTEVANYNCNYIYGKGLKGVARNQTTPVGSFKVANAFGLYDMHGNVWEWCQDTWHSNYEGAPIDGSVWVSENYNRSHLVRGGCWNFNPQDCRSAYRNINNPVYQVSVIGFRVVCEAIKTP